MILPWLTVPPLSVEAFKQLRREAVFECGKWDLQIGDVCALADSPILLTRAAWAELTRLALALAAETLAAETELQRRPRLPARLGLPPPVLKLLAPPAQVEPPRADVRVTRFDFHWTADGWRISEANTDVPGGYVEASSLTRAVARHYPGLSPAGDPSGSLATAIGNRLGAAGTVALVHATAFTDDRQVMRHLARDLAARGRQAQLVSPEHVAWEAGQARIRAAWHAGPSEFIFRFFPAEWLVNLPQPRLAEPFFFGSATPLCNPATALLTQSKRFPLVWDELETSLPHWRCLLPETRDPDRADWRHEEDWVLKPALGRVGDRIGLHGATHQGQWVEITRSIARDPRRWAAQRRFTAVPMETAAGPRFPCLGVYVIDGQIAGAYGRLARVPLIDQFAQDAAVLLEPPSAAEAEKCMERTAGGDSLKPCPAPPREAVARGGSLSLPGPPNNHHNPT